jgi:hypothetical protein
LKKVSQKSSKEGSVSEQQEQFNALFQGGKEALERGQYRFSVEALETAREFVNLSSRQGGDLQMWLVTAYQATGQMPEAIALCRQLTLHPNLDIRQKSRQVLYILEAPRLERPKEWMTQIPDLVTPEERPPQFVRSPQGKPPVKPAIQFEDLSQMNTKNNAFIWVALSVIALILVGMIKLN